MLASLIASIATGEIVDAVRRARVSMIVYLISGVALLCGVGFLLAAAFIAVADRYGSLHASLGFGAAFVILAFLILGIHRAASRARAKRVAERRAEQMKIYSSAAALGLLPSVIKSKSGVAGLIGPIIAIAAYAIWKENWASGSTEPAKDEDHEPS